MKTPKLYFETINTMKLCGIRILKILFPIGCLLSFLVACGQPTKEKSFPIPVGYENFRYPVYSMGAMGYIDAGGRVVVPIRYQSVREFSEGRGAVKLGGYWGYVDIEGNLVIPPQYIDAIQFSQGHAFVQDVDKRWLRIDEKGVPISSARFESDLSPTYYNGIILAGNFSGGYAYDESGRTIGSYRFLPGAIIDTSDFRIREAITQTRSKAPIPFHDPNTGLYSYRNLTGKNVLPALYKQAGVFIDGWAAVQLKSTGEWVMIDEQGTVKLNITSFMPKVNGAQFLSGGMVLVSVSGPLAIKSSRTLYGFISQNADRIITPSYIEAHGFDNGLAWVVSDKPLRVGYINKDNKFIWTIDIFAEARYARDHKGIKNDRDIPFEFRQIFDYAEKNFK